MKQNTSFKATTEIHVFIDFNCAANFGRRPRLLRNVNCSSGGHPPILKELVKKDYSMLGSILGSPSLLRTTTSYLQVMRDGNGIEGRI